MNSKSTESTIAPVITGDELLREQKKAFDLIEKTVGSTMGYCGKNVIINLPNFGGILNTKDGVTVAKSLKGENAAQDIFIDLIKSLAVKTDREVGDGTTTSIILALGLYKSLVKKIEEESSNRVVNRHIVKKGVDKALEQIIKNLETYKEVINIKDKKAINNIAKVSMNGDPLSDLISDIILNYGINASLDCKHVFHKETSYVVSNYYHYREGLFSHLFLPEGMGELTVKNLSVAIGDYTLTQELFRDHLIAAINPALEKGHNILIVVNDVEEVVVRNLADRNLNYVEKIFIAKTPFDIISKGKELRDLAAMCNSKIYTEADTKKALSFNDLGFIPESILSENYCKILYEKNARTQSYIKELEEKYKEESSELEKEKIQKRIDQLKGSNITLYINAQSIMGMTELKDRIVDGFNACKQSLLGGIIPGGGNPLSFIGSYLLTESKKYTENPDELLGFTAACEGIMEPLKKIHENAGITLQEDSIEGVTGTDLTTGKRVDLKAAGIIDPFNVTKAALINSFSNIGTLMLTDTIII